MLDVCSIAAFPLVGRLGIKIFADKLYSINFLPDSADLGISSDPLTTRVIAQLEAYFADPTFQFDLPLCSADTPFQAVVRERLCAIPAGEIRTYGDLGQHLGKPPRAIGQACRRNPLPIVVPCHRVVLKTGIGGFSGDERKVPIKQRLLLHEGVQLT